MIIITIITILAKIIVKAFFKSKTVNKAIYITKVLYFGFKAAVTNFFFSISLIRFIVKKVFLVI